MSKRILIVEDDLEIAMLEQDYQEIEGFQTQTVSAGEGAVYPTVAKPNLVEAPRVELLFAALEWL